ncbi:conjugal transfer protein TraD [Sphingomonas sp. BAUL-RG-20F-R05-02]|uniref:conjugal transfer protein TraD n=1 Tax=Sphingomonas sp. BAUL-RG-20F-R05-02 TaxID=2914830 RepID=UPI001F57F426|nr:conjugal transfer protein TraD [Sphingomonas sp. BAUL-RG-20F-R05-02]
MPKVRDYNAELKALEERARGLKAKRIEQLGSLVAATSADTLDIEILAGALLDVVSSKDSGVKEAWRAKGAAFFQRRGRKAGQKADGNAEGTATQLGIDSALGNEPASD